MGRNSPALRKSLKIIKYLIERNAHVNRKNKHDDTPLHFRCKINALLEIIRYLINNKADINNKGNKGLTPLDCASLMSNTPREIISYLIDNKADLNSKSDKNYTPLHCACYNNASLPIIKTLLASLIDTQVILTYFCCIKIYVKKIAHTIPKPIQLIILSLMITYDLQKYIDEKNKKDKMALTIAQKKSHENIILFFDSFQKSLNQRIIEIIMFFKDFDKAMKKEETALLEFLRLYKNNN